MWCVVLCFLVRCSVLQCVFFGGNVLWYILCIVLSGVVLLCVCIEHGCIPAQLCCPEHETRANSTRVHLGGWLSFHYSCAYICRRRVGERSSLSQVCSVCCSVLQFVAVCCSVLQCVAVCCSVLQCVAECEVVCVKSFLYIYIYIYIYIFCDSDVCAA